VGTIDLDLRFMIWNMGLIAANAGPEALDLFRKLLLASSSVPVAFPPVFFDIEAQSRRYDEMHVDGSVGTRVFYSGRMFSFAAARAASGRVPGREEIFVVHNGQLLPAAEPTRRRVRKMAELCEVGIRTASGTAVVDTASRGAGGIQQPLARSELLKALTAVHRRKGRRHRRAAGAAQFNHCDRCEYQGLR